MSKRQQDMTAVYKKLYGTKASQIIIDDPIGEERFQFEEDILAAHRRTVLGASLIKGAVADVLDHDCMFDMHADKSMVGLMYMTNCLCGEVGEVANVVKKLYRDGVTEERIAHLHEELVDVMIYLAEMVYVTDMNFDEAWHKKHEELRQRWERKKEKAGGAK